MYKRYFFTLYLLVLGYVFIGYSQTKMNFSLLSSVQTGIHFNNEIQDSKEQNILQYANFYGGAGVGIGDFNNDGLEDIYFAGNLVEDKLYFNQGNFKFKDVTVESGIINDNTWSTGVTVADINNDGYLDIYVSKELYDKQPNRRTNRLYINNGDGSFTEKAKEFGVANTERTRHATFLDIDNDGYLDLFILNQPPNPGSYSIYSGTELLQEKFASVLYRNINGTGFIDVTKKANIFFKGFPNGVTASDLNNDGYTDLFVSNDFDVPDAFFINNKDGTFTNRITNSFNHISYYSMGVDAADLNNDGLLDLHVVDMAAEDNFRSKSNMSGMNPKQFWKLVNKGNHYQYMFNNVHLNNGNTSFSEIAQLTNMATTDWSWANLIADFDNDGNKDVYITNGLLYDIRNTDADKKVSDYIHKITYDWILKHPNGGEINNVFDILDLKKVIELMPSQKLSNYMYQNKGNLKFKNESTKWGLDKTSFSNGAAYADLDNDGDLDLIVNNINEKAFVYRNNTTNNFLRIQLLSKKNIPVFGSKITLKNKDEIQFIELSNVRGIYSTSEQVAHFGLGNQSEIEEIKIVWPNGNSTNLKDIKANQKIEVFYEDAIKDIVDQPENKSTYLRETTGTGLTLTHKENIFNDYKYQVLLPHKMSQFGPAFAVGDVNGDGKNDVFMGGSAGIESVLMLQNKQGTFDTIQQPQFNKDRFSEDIDALFFDLDNDNDLDLYVVTGGNEFKEHNFNYNDKLYINDGKGNFTRDKTFLSSNPISGSVVKATDFDNDGDLDLFVGGRFKPRQYPVPTNGILYENQGGKLVDVSNNLAPELENLGLITDAIWSDYDTDGDKDLIIVGEWMPITIFNNDKGVFNKLELPDLLNSTGWWFSIEQADFDNDGDMDYVVGNLGLNYKYKTSVEEPFDVYYKDFDNNGKNDIVLGYYNYGEHFPLRGFSCSSEQIPDIKSNIKKYDLFASMNIEDVYGKKNLSSALHYKAKTFASSYMENLGNGKFKISELPIEAQFSNISDIIIEDVNGDNHLDIIAAGNMYGSEIETTRNDAGIGVVLLGDSKNGFKSVNHIQSGFFVNKDVKKLKLLEEDNKKYLFVINNNDQLQSFEFTDNKKPITKTIK